MAQFGKHLFGTSFFGKTSTFDGEYQTPIVDAYDLFTGKINVRLNALLPFHNYSANSRDIVFENKDNWTISEGLAASNAQGNKISMLAAGDVFYVNVKEQEAGGQATIVFRNVHTEEEESFIIDSSTEGQKKIQLAFADYYISLITEDANSFVFEGFTIRVANVGVEVRTASTLNEGRPEWGEYKKVEMDLTPSSENEYEEFEGVSQTFNNQRYIQVKIHLATSDSEGSPILDALHFSSGDLSKHALAGYWQAALNFNNIAKDEGVSFRRVKRVEWTEREAESSQARLNSTSVQTSANNTSIPSRLEVLDSTYWKEETAPYVLKHNGSETGIPWSRISLAEAENHSSESAHLASVFIGPINARNANLTNTKLKRWATWDDQSFYPTNRQNVNILYELYKNEADLNDGYAPIFSVSNPESLTERIVSIATEDETEQLYLRIQLERVPGRQSPVVDYVDIEGEMHYQSPSALGAYTSELSPLDGVEGGRLGYQKLQTIKDTLFDWPSLNQSLEKNKHSLLKNLRRVRVAFQPRYHDQISIGIGEELDDEQRFPADVNREFELYSLVTAKTPSASTNTVPRDELFWHFSYDGGTVNFPVETKRELSGQYTPSLLENKNYRFYLRNGWRDETFQVPTSMTLEEVSDIVGTSTEELIKKNGQIKLYDNRIPMGYTLTLPNDSMNDRIRLRFKLTDGLVTEQSFLSGKENDEIVAWVPEGENFEYIDWVSNEVSYEGIINPNDSRLPYVRTQHSTMNSRKGSSYVVENDNETVEEIAKKYAVDVEDLKLANQGRNIFSQGEEVLIPAGFVLPDITPGLIYEGENPYVIEIIPNTVRKVLGNIRLPEDILIAGSDDEPAIRYTLKESPSATMTLTRGDVLHGEDIIPVSNVMNVLSIVNSDTGVHYTQHLDEGGSELGDYVVRNNRIVWAPTHENSKEPAAGETYTITYTRGIVDSLRIVYTSDYSERMAQDRLWRSKDTIVMDEIIQPGETLQLELPRMSEFSDYQEDYQRVEYIVEDNDIWVDTSIIKEDGTYYLKATMNGEDPQRNWYPLIQTGFYYLNEQEHYMYSEATETHFKENDVPILKNVSFDEHGLSIGLRENLDTLNNQRVGGNLSTTYITESE